MDDRFAELKPQIEALAARLFGASQMAVRKRGRFLPRGALLDAGGEVRLVMATPDDLDAPASPAEVLPRLLDALCAGARDHAAAAVAVCEDLTITPAGGKSPHGRAVPALEAHDAGGPRLRRSDGAGRHAGSPGLGRGLNGGRARGAVSTGQRQDTDVEMRKGWGGILVHAYAGVIVDQLPCFIGVPNCE